MLAEQFSGQGHGQASAVAHFAELHPRKVQVAAPLVLGCER
jgi:hypothetical protein